MKLIIGSNIPALIPKRPPANISKQTPPHGFAANHLKGKKMTKNEQKSLELVQQVYFDLCDIINGNTYKSLGYDTKLHFLIEQRNRLAEIENRLFPQESEAAA